MAPRQGAVRVPGSGITRTEFMRRRRQLMRMAGDDAAILVAAAPERMRNADAAWPYRQDSDFHYLCGFSEPQALLALLPGRKQGEVILFCRERDAAAERLHGPRVGTEAVVDDYGLDDAFPIDDIDDILPGLLEGRACVYCHFGRDVEFDQHLLAWMRRLRTLRGGGVVPKEFVSLGHLLHDLRLFKSRAELKWMRRAADVAVEAHLQALRMVRPGAAEYEVEAEWIRVLRAQGVVPSFPPCVAAGDNACIAHYQANNAMQVEGDLLLVDAGAEVGCYASDLARTYPIGGRFSAEQRALYDIVWTAQQAALDVVHPEFPFEAAHLAAVRVLVEGLRELKLLSGSVDGIIESGAYRQFYPYKTGHWLGLDVHDVGDYRVDGDSRVLEPGMVLTVEPGIYVQPDDVGVAARWRGIGIRIEDDVAVTRDGHEILTGALPSEASAIEALMRESQGRDGA